MNKILEVPITIDGNSVINNIHFNLSSISAKSIKDQKIRHSKENLLTFQNALTKLNKTHLNLNHIGMCTFPVDILNKLTNLQIMYLDSNNLTEIPNEFFIKLKNLKWLDIRNNKLISIPLNIKGHTSLETFLLQGNNIEKLPLELGLAPNLKNLQIAYNPLIFPPQEVLHLDCLQIINFLRNEWNNENPHEMVKLKKINNDKIDKKSSTIIYYQPTSKKLFKSKMYKNFQNTAKTAIKSRTRTYKPSCRCQSSAGNIALQQKMLWLRSSRQLLLNQAADLQKLTDKSVLNEWRYNYKKSKRESNTLKYSLDTPFGLHVEGLEENINKKIKSSKAEPDYINSRNFNENFNKFVKSFKKIDTYVSGCITPYSEQKNLQAEIIKITELQRKLQNLKLYNDSVIAPYKGSENLSKKYISSPSIII